VRDGVGFGDGSWMGSGSEVAMLLLQTGSEVAEEAEVAVLLLTESPSICVVDINGELVSGGDSSEGKAVMSVSSSDKSLEWNHSFARSKSVVVAAS